MKKISLAVVSAVLAIGMVAPAMAAQADPEVIIYRFPGVKDNGGTDNVGITTVFFCTNFSGATENIRFVARGDTGSLLANVSLPIQHLTTKTVSTHGTLVYPQDLLMNTSVINQGTTAIAATSVNIICTAVTIDASANTPIGVALRGIRFSPVPGSQE